MVFVYSLICRALFDMLKCSNGNRVRHLKLLLKLMMQDLDLCLIKSFLYKYYKEIVMLKDRA
jgi:hypothetical protein